MKSFMIYLTDFHLMLALPEKKLLTADFLPDALLLFKLSRSDTGKVYNFQRIRKYIYNFLMFNRYD